MVLSVTGAFTPSSALSVAVNVPGWLQVTDVAAAVASAKLHEGSLACQLTWGVPGPETVPATVIGFPTVPETSGPASTVGGVTGATTGMVIRVS